MKPPTLSVCVVAKNAANTYQPLFNSLREFADRGGDMVLVDTGSTDDTQAIYLAFGFRVFPVGDRFRIQIPVEVISEINCRAEALGDPAILDAHASLFSFADARNHAASLALNDFVLNPDSDEALTVFDIPGVESAAQRVSRFRYDFVFNHHPDGSPDLQFVTDTRASDRRHWKWKGHVHETMAPITPSPTMEYIPPSIFKIEHWQKPSPTRSSYLAGLAYACHIEPDNDRNSHYYGRELFYRGRYHSAIRELTRHIEMNRWDRERSQSMVYIGDCWQALGQDGAALKAWSEAFAMCGTSREPLMRLADYWYHKYDHRRAAAYAAAALEIEGDGFYGNTPSYYKHYPHEILYWAKWWLGDKEGSKQHWQQALQWSPAHPKYQADAEFYPAPGWVEK